ncbi:hypothetical protein D3C86_2140570 [compost metagenome]
MADARWVNLDTGESIEESHSDQQLLGELEALRSLVRQLTEKVDQCPEEDSHSE